MFKHRKRDRSPLQVTKHGHAFWTKLTHIEKLDLCLRIIFPKFEPDPSFNLLGGGGRKQVTGFSSFKGCKF